MSRMPLSIGVLITYYGERDLLRECLDSLANQAQLPDELRTGTHAFANYSRRAIWMSSLPRSTFMTSGAFSRLASSTYRVW
jgi:hypothetical protein